MAVNNVSNPSTQSGALVNSNASGTKKANETAAAAKTAANAYAKASRVEPSIKDAANVQISQKAREMNLAKQVLDATPDVREDKVAKYKEMIAKGEYKPDASKIAEGMIREAARDELAKNPDLVLED